MLQRLLPSVEAQKPAEQVEGSPLRLTLAAVRSPTLVHLKSHQGPWPEVAGAAVVVAAVRGEEVEEHQPSWGQVERKGEGD